MALSGTGKWYSAIGGKNRRKRKNNSEINFRVKRRKKTAKQEQNSNQKTIIDKQNPRN